MTTVRRKFDPVEEFIGHQLHSISGVDAGMMPLRPKGKGGKKPWRWWPYPTSKQSKSFHTSSYEDRLIGAIDKKYRKSPQSRQEEILEMLGEGYQKKEVAELLKVSSDTITRDVKKIRMRLAWEKSKKSPTQ